MTIVYICIPIFGMIIKSFALSAVQTDWSGGPYIQGPVTLWDDSFDSGLPVNWYTSPGYLGLEYFPAFTLISSSLNGPASIECIDLESDGDHDLLVCGLNEPGAVVVFENQASGSIWVTRPVDLEVVCAFCARSGDFNGDLLLDFVAVIRPEGSSWERHLVVYFGQADGTWQKFTISEDCHNDRDLCPADVDSDGDLDFLCSIPGWAWFGWFENMNGSGTSWEWHALFSYSPSVVWSSEPLDFDYDGDIDVLLVPSYHNRIYLLENLGGGNFAEHEVNEALLNNPTCASSGDIDGDGDMDVVGSAMYGTVVYWFEQTEPMTWIQHTIMPDSTWDYCWRGICCADFDKDGDEDVYAVLRKEGSATWFENLDGSGGSWRKHHADWCSGAWGCCSGDFNSDGNIDIATTAEWSDIVRWVDLTKYPDNGMLESSILYLGCDPAWDAISWTADKPAGTSISFQLRASDDPESMGSWSDTLDAPSSIEGVLNDGDSYLQYRVILETTVCRTTPILEDITVSWASVGIGDITEPVPPSNVLLCVTPNPSLGYPLIRFGLSEPGNVSLTIMDLSGRFVCEISNSDYSAGYHDVHLADEIPSGVYFCFMNSGVFSAVQRFVVIR